MLRTVALWSRRSTMAEATRVSEDLVPVAEAAIGGEDDRAPVVAAADHLKDPVGRGLVEGQVTQLVDDQHRGT
jgi:hypothetical protein